MFRIISRHIFKHLFLTTIVLATVLVFGAWLTQSLRFIEIIIEKDITVGRYLSMVYLLLPSLTALVLPVCTLLATVYTLQKLIADNEATIYKSCGYSNVQIATPVIFWGLIMMVVCAFLNNYLGPKSNEQFQSLRNQLAREFSAGVIRDGVFNKFKATVIFVGSHAADGRLRGVYLQDRGDGVKPGFTIFAQGGYLKTVDNQNTLVLFNGCRQEIDKAKGTHTIAHFNEFKYDLNINNDIVEKVKLRTKLGFWQMMFPPTDLPDSTKAKLIIEAHKRIINPLFVITFSLFSAAILLSGQFTRRGRWKKIVLAVGGSVCLEMSILSVLNSLAKNPWAILISYSIIFVLMVVGILLLIKDDFYRNWGLRRVDHVH